MGLFITVDGPNGVGKTTVLGAVRERLRADSADILSVRQPSDSDLGSLVRTSEKHLTGMALAVLVVADRYMQIETDIKPALAGGRTVLCDRYVASTLVLQRLDGLRLETLWEMNAQALVPDLCVLLTADPSAIEQRLNERGRTTRFERMSGIATLETTYFSEAFKLLRAVGYTTREIATNRRSPEAVADEIAAAAHHVSTVAARQVLQRRHGT